MVDATGALYTRRMAFADSAIIREAVPRGTTVPVAAGARSPTGPTAQASIPPQTGLRELAFDGIISLGHKTSIGLTSYPTEAGSDLFDHTFDNPNAIRMVGGVSLLADTSPLTAWALIQQLKLSRRLVTLSTNLGSYTNMILTDASTTESVDNQGALWVELAFKELLIAGGTGPAGGFSVIPTGPAENRYSTNVHRGFIEALAAGS